MDDLTDLDHLRRMRNDIADPTTDALIAARTALHEKMTTPATADLGHHRSRRQRTSLHSRTLHSRTARRVAFSIVGVAAIAGTVFALTAGPTTSGRPTPQARGDAPIGAATPTHTSSPVPAPPAAVVHYVNAAQVLDTASAQALSTPGLEPGQYGHTTIHRLYVSQLEDPPNNGAYEFPEDRLDYWIPSRLASPAYLHERDDISVHFPNAKQRRYAEANDADVFTPSASWDRLNDADEPVGGTPGCSNCGKIGGAFAEPARANLAHLTTDPVQLRQKLFAYARSQNKELTGYGKSSRVNSLALDTVNRLISGGDAPSALRAALFQVAKTIPGIKITGRMANYDGVRGTGIGLTNTWGVTQSLIFSSHGVYLGEKEVLTGGPTLQYELPAGTVTAWTAYTFDITGKPTVPHSK